MNNRELKACISGTAIKDQARLLYSSSGNTAEKEFKSSDGWLQNYLSRHNLKYRRVTTTGRELPSNTGPTLRNFFNDCNNIFRKVYFNRDKIFNMDETSIYLDYPSNYTYDKRGTRRVKANTAGSERTRMSAAFTASGSKLPIVVLVPRKTEIPDYVPPDNVLLIYKTAATFNDDVLVEYLERVMSGKQGSTLFIDSAKCNTTNKVSVKFDELEINSYIIPPRMTNLIQPADVGWFAKIKATYHKKWNHWFLFGDKTFTKHNNMRSPGYVKSIQLLSEIWSDFDPACIRDSFE